MKTIFSILLLFNFLYAEHDFGSIPHDIFLISLSILLLIATIVLTKKTIFLNKEKSFADKEKENLKTLLEYADDGVYILDLDGNIYDCSKSFYYKLDYKYDEILKSNIKNIDLYMNDVEFENLVKEIIDSPSILITKFRKRNGEHVDIEVHTKAILLNNETYIYASARDISKRVKLEKELSYEKNFLDNLFDNIDAVVATITPDGTMNRVNKYTEKITGCTQEEISSKPYFWFEKFIPSDLKPDIKSKLKTLAESGEVISKKENEWVVKDGKKRLFEWSNKVIYENNEPAFLLTVGIDISHRKKLELELKDINENLELKVNEATKKLNHSLDIIEKYVITSKTDLDGNIIEVSDKFCEVSKYEREELIGKPHSVIRHPNTPNSLFKEIWQTIKSGKSWSGRIQNRTKTGESYWVDSIISLLYDEKNIHIGYFSYRIDVTQEMKNIEIEHKHNLELKEKVKKQLEEIRQKDIKMFEQAKLASVGELLTNIAHQWRQPLNVISVCSSGARYGLEFGGLTKEEILEQFKSIDESCENLTKTIETFSKYVNKNNSDFSLFSIEKEIEFTKNIIEPSLKSNLITLIDEIDYSKKHMCYMVENELSQVLVNIINNAQEALENKLLEENKWIKISSLIDENNFTIMIEDNAGGIPNEIINRVFEPYFTTKFKSQGTGLGLSISHSIVTEHLKGDIYVENSENGAKFYIVVPLSL